MTTYAFRLPDLGEGVAEGEVSRWLVAEGQAVAEDEPLLEIQTDKTAVEVPSPVAGRVERLLVDAGEVVPIGTALVEIATADDDAEVPVAAAAEPERVQALPAVRRLAAQLGVPLAALSGTGPRGQVTEADVRAAATPRSADAPGVRARETLSGVRRAIADHVARAHREVPAVTVVEECDVTALEAARGDRSLLAFVLRSVASSLAAHPRLNATLEGQEVVLWERCDLGVAVQTDRGLLVPVVRGAGQRSVAGLDAEVRRLADGARAASLRPDELRGSTFTVTSAGRLGGLFATPLVNVPEVAILGVHRIDDRAVVRGGQVVARRVGWLSCTFDHRAVDGVEATAFLLDVIAELERDPAETG